MLQCCQSYLCLISKCGTQRVFLCILKRENSMLYNFKGVYCITRNNFVVKPHYYDLDLTTTDGRTKWFSVLNYTN